MEPVEAEKKYMTPDELWFMDMMEGYIDRFGVVLCRMIDDAEDNQDTVRKQILEEVREVYNSLQKGK